MMITDKDIKSLKGPSCRLYTAFLIMLVLSIGLFSYATFNNISLSIHYAEQFGLDLNATFSLWNSEPDLKRTYSGYEQQSLHRLNLAIIDFGVVIFLIIQLVSTSYLRKRNQRILLALIESGAISSEQLPV